MTDHINRWLLASAAAYLFLLPTNAATFARSVTYGVAAICALVTWFGARRRGTAIPMAGAGILVPLFAWAAWSWASLAWSIDRRYSLGQLEREVADSLLVMLAFYVAARDGRSLRVLVVAALSSFASFALLAIGMSAIEGSWDPARYHLGVGPWSTWLVLVAPFLLALIARRPAGFGGGAWRAALGFALLALLVVSARMSENRIVWIALGISFATAALAAAWRWWHSFTRAPMRWILPATLLLVVLGAAFIDSLVERAETVYQGRESVAATLEHDPRIVLWERVQQRIAARPWTGYGFGKRILAGPLSAELGNPLLAHAHNVFASQWLQTGLPGLAAFAAFLAALALRYLRFLRSRDDPLAFIGVLGLALVAGFLAKNQTDDFLFRSNAKEFWAMTAMLLGYGMRRERALAAGDLPAQAGDADAASAARKRFRERVEPTL
ncbi:MAG TPA: O-antigen ligase family protein [Casimicrobiaceae bacterium]|nr:O-antigen ligase family protein [Casimicrobiaceae bacterium]